MFPISADRARCEQKETARIVEYGKTRDTGFADRIAADAASDILRPTDLGRVLLPVSPRRPPYPNLSPCRLISIMVREGIAHLATSWLMLPPRRKVIPVTKPMVRSLPPHAFEAQPVCRLQNAGGRHYREGIGGRSVLLSGCDQERASCVQGIPSGMSPTVWV